VPLAAEDVVAGEHVVDVLGDAAQHAPPFAATEALEHAAKHEPTTG
jgi:hypothetical protein